MDTEHYNFNIFFIYSAQQQILDCKRTAGDRHKKKYLKGSMVVQNLMGKEERKINYLSLGGD